MNSDFTVDDKIIARSLLRSLPPKQRKALVLRFWHNYTLFEVAKALRTTWSEADKIVKDALIQMKDECLSQPRFSRVLNNYHSTI